MAKDPYEDGPSLEELEASGATEWFSDSIQEQKQRNARLRSSLNGETGSIRAGKKELESLLQLPPDLNPEPDVPDLFAAERDAVRKQKSSLSSLVGDLREGQAAEKDLLKNLFGK